MEDDRSIMKKSLSTLIAERLKENIWDRKLQLGERLVESEQAERFDVSRSTIREALKLLEHKGLVVNKARRGTYVSQFSREDLQEIIDLRILIETKAFINALTHLDESHFQHLSEIVAAMKEKAEEKEWNALFDLDMKFHSYVVNLCRNSRMIKIYNSTQTQTRAYLGYIDKYYSNHHAFYKEHVDLLETLMQKDTVALQTVLRRHIEYADNTLIIATKEEDLKE
ncbi:GntR family transcriptional regulator [Virgibacillus sp. W0430]|uniref:GntR family transcriptional regulator n=1 Tax=Virgibacillus sp. W0430 TaxID=3391580 RepID=UPI003F45770C